MRLHEQVAAVHGRVRHHAPPAAEFAAGMPVVEGLQGEGAKVAAGRDGNVEMAYLMLSASRRVGRSMTDEELEERASTHTLLRWARAMQNGHAALHYVTVDEALDMAMKTGSALPPEVSMAVAVITRNGKRK